MAKHAEYQEQKKRWKEFKESYYWGMMMGLLDESIEEYSKITNVKVGAVTPKDFEDLGKLTAVRMEIYEGIKEIKGKFQRKTT